LDKMDEEIFVDRVKTRLKERKKSNG